MTQGFYDDDDDLGDEGGQGQQQQDGPKTNSDFAWRRKQEQERKKAEAERDAAKRELAIIKAGVDPATPLGALFVKAYDGEPDPEKVKEAAIAAGVLQAAPSLTPEQIAQQQQQQAELSAGARISGAATAATSAPTEGEARINAVREAYAKGGVDGMTAALAQMGLPSVEN